MNCCGEFRLGDYVTHIPTKRRGKVVDVTLNELTVQMEDGSHFICHVTNTEHFVPLDCHDI